MTCGGERGGGEEGERGGREKREIVGCWKEKREGGVEEEGKC